MKRRSPFATRGQLPAGSTANAEAKASAKSQASAGASTGVRVHPSRCTPQTSSVSAAQSTSAIEMGAIDHGSAAASRRKETVEARVRASDNLEGLAVRRERQLLLVPEHSREMDAAQDPGALRALRERMPQTPRRSREHERKTLRPGEPLQGVDQERQILVLLPGADVEDVRGRERPFFQEP